MKQVQFARLVGVTAVSASDWERDVYSPSDENWAKIEEVLGVPRSELEHGFGSSTQETFNAGIREGLRRGMDALSKLALDVMGRTDVPVVPVERVTEAEKKRRAKE